MSKSKLLKEAIADAKAVRETAIANAKIALEEAFTPRLQSILSKKLTAEIEGEEELEEELDSSEIGTSDNKEPADDAQSAHTELGSETDSETAEPGEEDENVEVVAEEESHDGEEEISEGEYGDEETHEEGYGEEEIEEEEEDDLELDLEAIIRELEGEDDEEAHEGTYEGEGHEEELEEESPAHDAVGYEDPTNADDAEINEEEESEIEEEEHGEEEVSEEEDVIDLDEILREMGYGDDEEVSEEEEEDHSAQVEELEDELEEAYKTIKSLRGTINEVNLLNAKLLYTNKLFRGYNLTNEQKVKVVENLDRTTSVREVKLVYATLAESIKFGGTVTKKVKKNITEGFASKTTKSTAPKQEVITESANVLAERFKKLAGIN